MRSATFELHLANLILSGALLFTRWIDAPVPVLIVGRCVIGALFLGLFLAYEKPEFSGGWPLWMCGIIMALHWVTFFWAGRLSSIGVAMVAMYTYPVMTALAEPIVEKGRMAAGPDLLLAALATLGVTILGFNSSAVALSGLLLGVLSAALITTRNLLVRHRLGTANPSMIMYAQLIIAGLALSPALFFYDYKLNVQDLLFWLLLGAIFTALAHTLFVRALQRMRASSAGIIASIQPVYSAILAFLFFREVPDGWFYLGGGLVVLASILESWRSQQVVASKDVVQAQ